MGGTAGSQALRADRKLSRVLSIAISLIKHDFRRVTRIMAYRFFIRRIDTARSDKKLRSSSGFRADVMTDNRLALISLSVE